MSIAQNLSNEILTDIEKEHLMKFAEDQTTFEIVKKYVLAVCYKQGVVNAGQDHNPSINYALNLAWGATNQGGMPRSDEELGQSLRAMTYAVQLIGSGFKEISDLREAKTLVEENSNPGE